MLPSMQEINYDDVPAKRTAKRSIGPTALGDGEETERWKWGNLSRAGVRRFKWTQEDVCVRVQGRGTVSPVGVGA